MIRALVFDFDGLILDTEGPIFLAWQEAFEAHGCTPLTVAEWAEEIGTVGGLDVMAAMRERATRPIDEPAMHATRRARAEELIGREIVRPGVHAWLDDADASGIPAAIASSSAPEWVETHLARLGLGARFAHVACRGAGARAKPAPDTYLAACEALGVAAIDALAIEDSPHGIRAAKDAGLWCLAVPHAITEPLDLSAADVRLRSLADASLADVVAQLERMR